MNPPYGSPEDLQDTEDSLEESDIKKCVDVLSKVDYKRHKGSVEVFTPFNCLDFEEMEEENNQE